MNAATELRYTGQLPEHILATLDGQDWLGLIAALDDGLPANLTVLGDVPLFECVLETFESRVRPRDRVDVPPAPMELLAAFLRNGLNRTPCYGGHATAVSIALNYGQWAWAERLIDENYPVEGPHGSALHALLDGRLQRAIRPGKQPPAADHPPAATLVPDPFCENVQTFPRPLALHSSVEGVPSVEAAPSGLLLEDSAEETFRVALLIGRLAEAGARLEERGGQQPPPLELGASIARPDGAFTPLMQAIAQLDAPVIAGLIQAGADVSSRPAGLMQRPLELAIARGSTPIVDLLLVGGAPLGLDPTLPLPLALQNQPLVLAARLNLGHLVGVIAPHMSEEALTEYGPVAMHAAAAMGHVGAMRAVRLLGVPYDVPTRGEGYLPIHQAALGGRVQALTFLLRRGQSWSVCNRHGLSAEDLLRSHHPELLKSFGLTLAGGNVHALIGRRRKP